MSICGRMPRHYAPTRRQPLPTEKSTIHSLHHTTALLLAENDAAGNHPRTHARFALAVHDVGQMGAGGAAKPPFATRPLFVLPTVCVTADSFPRWDSRSWCTVRSCLQPETSTDVLPVYCRCAMKTSRTVCTWSRVCVSAGTRSIREKLPMGSISWMAKG
ncbi:hypothetical protein DFH08DRAFT_893442 [Mycena albidolilacea]|uniref:Uncharacterized protein n=1 Tax=Mycena albidolilacea TaxID=1033008 RepID=A0AAD7EDU1_9AGAR|nr:hypothetical protein DFH08DRAFT_893442 [Mycena albidolilacea]